MKQKPVFFFIYLTVKVDGQKNINKIHVYKEYVIIVKYYYHNYWTSGL